MYVEKLKHVKLLMIINRLMEFSVENLPARSSHVLSMCSCSDANLKSELSCRKFGKGDFGRMENKTNIFLFTHLYLYYYSCPHEDALILSKFTCIYTLKYV
jgi:hypothetical protein